MAETVNTDAPAYIVDGVLTDGEAWVPLITNVLTGTATTITFQSSTGANDWSQYMDLMLVIYVASTRAADYSLLNTHLNSDTTAANYPYQSFYGTGASATATASTSSRGIDTRNCAGASSTNIFSAITINLFDVNSGKYKSAVSQTATDLDGSAFGQAALVATTWKSQAPITSITFTDLYGDDIAAGSRFDLFGVLPRMVTA